MPHDQRLTKVNVQPNGRATLEQSPHVRYLPMEVDTIRRAFQVCHAQYLG